MLSACGGSPSAESSSDFSPPESKIIQGKVSVSFTETAEEAVARVNKEVTIGDYSCINPRGFEDIADGAQVRITAADGTIIAVGALAAGETSDSACEFAFKVEEVLMGEKFYGVHVGNEHRGVVQFTEEAMRRGPLLRL